MRISAIFLSASLMLSVAIAQVTPQSANEIVPRGALFWVTRAAMPGDLAPASAPAIDSSRTPGFGFHWKPGGGPDGVPDKLQGYLVILHYYNQRSSAEDGKRSQYWRAFTLPKTANGMPEVSQTGDPAPDVQTSDSIASRIGPGAGPGPIDHYLFEFYALDVNLDLQADMTPEALQRAIGRNVVAKTTWFERAPTR